MKNRRRGPDFVISVINWISVVIWIIIAVVVVMLIIMKPTSSGMQLSRPALQSASSKAFSGAIFIFLVIQLILSIAGIIFNTTRLKRKTDTIRLTLIFSGIFAVIGLILMSIR